MKLLHYATFVGLAALHASIACASESAPRERLLLDANWKFHLGDNWGSGNNLAKAASGYGPAGTSYSAASWREVRLPHDWAVEQPFDPAASCAQGFKTLGDNYRATSIGWYRRSFDIPASDLGQRIWIEFDGVLRDCTVFINGWAVGQHASGYSSFRYDITDVVNYGAANIVTVRVDATQSEGWFYEGAGIYRHAWLVKTAPLALAPDGVFVRSSFNGPTPDGPATIHLEARLQNTLANSTACTVEWEILAPDAQIVAHASTSADAPARAFATVLATTSVATPTLWSPESPHLYKLVTRVLSQGKLLDRTETEFGIRTVSFDPEKGFILNGHPYLIKGTCNHQDHAGVGAALPDQLQYFRISRLKEMGSNAYRSSHNAPTPELLEACDRLGMLVMDENRLLGSDAAGLDRLERLIRRDRNHPSVVIWSIANEEWNAQDTPAGARVATTMQTLIKQLDPTRPITCAVNGTNMEGINAAIEVHGWNYNVNGAMDEHHQKRPLQPHVGSEQGSTVSTRGIYTNDPVRGYVSAYDDNITSWSATAKTWTSFFAARPWLSGGFVWTGFDYRGEPTPYRWPCISSHFGILDTCGFPKDNFWYYQALWSNKSVLHLLPHWNWSGREGQEIDVRALSNCDEVELFLNNRSLGRQARTSGLYELKWKVPYTPGALSAKGYTKGALITETQVTTTGPAVKITLTPDRSTIAANNEDISIITVASADATGLHVPTASAPVTFELTGPGRIIGVGNGDPSCHEPDVVIPSKTSHDLPITHWKWKKGSVSSPVAIETENTFDDSTWETHDSLREKGPLGETESGIFRARFTLEAKDLTAQAVELVFNKIEGGGNVFLNGQKIGSTGDSRYPSIYDAKSLLKAGENTITVVLANYDAHAGVNKGVSLRLTDHLAPGTWSRSLFNGLAQIIIQTNGQPGVIHLKASSPQIQAGELTITATPANLRPSLP